MKQELISVIIPVYNVEKYLDKCLESVVNQTYKKLEIILIDDGSLDKSGEMCDQWAKKDKRIKVVHKPNGGLSDARNVGLDMACGSLIAFVDSDDYISENMYEKLYFKQNEDNADVVLCNYILEYEDKKKYYVKDNFNDLSVNNIRTRYLNNNQTVNGKYIESDGVLATVWRGLYKRQLFEKVKFERGMFCEDIIFHLSLFKSKLKISTINDYLYHYLQREGSIINSYNDAKISKRIVFTKRILELISGVLEEEIVERYKFFLYKAIVYDIIFASNRESCKNHLNSIKTLNLNSKRSYKLFNSYTKDRKTKIMNFLVHHNMLKALRFVMKLKNKR